MMKRYQIDYYTITPDNPFKKNRYQAIIEAKIGDDAKNMILKRTTDELIYKVERVKRLKDER